MIIRHIYISLFVIVSLLASCDPAPRPQLNSSRGEVKESRDPDGTRKVWWEVDGLLDGRTIVYQPEGTIGAIFRFRRDSLHGLQYRYYPNGKPMLLEEARGGQLEGPSYRFFESGRVAYVRNMVHGKRVGRYREFYDLPGSPLRLENELVIVAGKEHKNGYVMYDSIGRVKDCWGFPKISTLNDTVRLNDNITLTIRVRCPKEHLILAGLDSYDEEFRKPDSAHARVTYGKNHVVNLRTRAVQRGQQVLRGYVSDYKLNPAKREQGITSTMERRMYFAYPYYVR